MQGNSRLSLCMGIEPRYGGHLTRCCNGTAGTRFSVSVNSAPLRCELGHDSVTLVFKLDNLDEIAASVIQDSRD